MPQGLKANKLAGLMSGLKPGPTQQQGSHADSKGASATACFRPERL
jgi:hypothetical protein